MNQGEDQAATPQPRTGRDITFAKPDHLRLGFSFHHRGHRDKMRQSKLETLDHESYGISLCALGVLGRLEQMNH